MKTVYLVTGGAGFIGSNFVKSILKTGNKVIVLDALTYAGNLNNISPIIRDDNLIVCSEHRRLAEVVLDQSGNVTNVNHDFDKERSIGKYGARVVKSFDVEDLQKAVTDCLQVHDAIFIHGDISDSAVVSKIMTSADMVVNFAAETHVDRSILDPGGFIKTDVYGTYNLLECARKCENIKKFVHISTDEVYGSAPTGTSFKESDSINPRNPYSASKAAADRLVFAYNQTYGLPVNIIRPSNNFGPFQYPEKMIPVMIIKALANEPLPVYGNGLQIRDWLYVDDNVLAIELVAKEGEAGEVYNVSGRNERTNIEVVRHILHRLGVDESLIKFVKDRPGHDVRYSIDDSKIREKLGYKGGEHFERNLEKTIDWYLENREWWMTTLRSDSQYLEFIHKWYEERR